jgi:hypothetical protein
MLPDEHALRKWRMAAPREEYDKLEKAVCGPSA